LEVQSSDAIDRTRRRLNAFVQRRQDDLRFYHPDPNDHSPCGEIGFEFLHGDGYVKAYRPMPFIHDSFTVDLLVI
jgi:hypothetical protein